MKKFILTGGIGSGKSLAGTYFEKLGAQVIDTDNIAKIVTSPNSQTNQQLIQIFGKNVLLENKSLNKEYIRQIIFNDTEQKKILENILHPIIQKYTLQISQNIQSLKPQTKYILYAVPLYLGSNKTFWQQQTQGVITIYSDIENRLNRIMQRYIEKDIAIKIIQSQPDNDEYIRNSNFYIKNDTTKQELFNSIQILHTKLINY